MKTFEQIREGFVSAAQRKAVWASKADGGKGHPDNKKEDSDAVKAFLAKGGKIKKLPPAKAQGYHGKDDPGKGMHGMMDKPDTKAMGTRKKVKSMEANENYQVQKYTKGKKDGPAKSFGGDLKKATAHASKMGGDHRVHKENSVDEQGAGLWANIRAKRARGDRMRKPGEKGAPTPAAIKSAQGK